MRDKQEILEMVQNDIISAPYGDNTHLRIQYHLIEALLDIRDQLSLVTMVMGTIESIAYRVNEQ